MSGGSYNYAFRHVGYVADEIKEVGECSAASPELRKAFKEHLRLVEKALRAIEWNDSCDGDDDEEALIKECLHL